jgi:hypothetical protein
MNKSKYDFVETGIGGKGKGALLMDKCPTQLN